MLAAIGPYPDDSLHVEVEQLVLPDEEESQGQTEDHVHSVAEETIHHPEETHRIKDTIQR